MMPWTSCLLSTQTTGQYQTADDDALDLLPTINTDHRTLSDCWWCCPGPPAYNLHRPPDTIRLLMMPWTSCLLSTQTTGHYQTADDDALDLLPTINTDHRTISDCWRWCPWPPAYYQHRPPDTIRLLMSDDALDLLPTINTDHRILTILALRPKFSALVSASWHPTSASMHGLVLAKVVLVA